MHGHSHGHRHGPSQDPSKSPAGLSSEQAHECVAARSSSGGARLVAALAVNLLLTVVQVAGGVVSGSLALIADALHNLSDAGSILVAYVAMRIGKRPADAQQTFGYRRVELVGALINATTLVLIGLYLVAEAIERMISPQDVAGWTVIGVAAIALVVDAATAMLTYAMSKESLNVKAAFIHNVTDALGSVAVIVAGALVLLFGWRSADVIATLLIAAYAIYQGVATAREAARMLTLGVPRGLDLNEVVSDLLRVGGVADLHHVHAWDLDESTRSFEAHVVIDPMEPLEAEDVKCRVRAALARHGILHSTLEIEQRGLSGCTDGKVVVPH
jgi:cobalt-zinc-cadmium efflux system protein